MVKRQFRTTDYIQQLANYIKKNLAKGYTLDSLRFALQSQDYSRSSIERAIKLANAQLAKTAPVMKEKPVIKFERIPLSEESPRIIRKSWWKQVFG